MSIYSKKLAKPQSVQQILWGVDPDQELGPGYSQEFRAVSVDAASQLFDEVVETGIVSGLYYYARKKPLTFVGRVIGHGLPVVAPLFWAYDAYQLANYFLND